MKYLVTYDIKNHKRWYRVFRIMKDLGLNVQLSCFEIDVSNYEFEKLVRKIAGIVDWKEDSIYFFPLSEFSTGLTVKLGKTEELNEDKVI